MAHWAVVDTKYGIIAETFEQKDRILPQPVSAENGTELGTCCSIRRTYTWLGNVPRWVILAVFSHASYASITGEPVNLGSCPNCVSCSCI